MAAIIFLIAMMALVIGLIVVIQFPEVTDVIISASDAIIFYIGQALDIVWIFVPKTSTLALMSIAITVEGLVLGYHFVMWVVRKLPVGSE